MKSDSSLNHAMTDPPTCPVCGGLLAQGSRCGMCPACLLHAAIRGDSEQHQAPDEADTVQWPPAMSEQPGTRIGHYKLLEQIGEGGFGAVWMAEQEEPVRRRVALKIIKLGMDTREVVARFEAERQALAMMEHPKIASVFDGGATDTGRPFFVMELVKGVPITTYCDANQLTTKVRLSWESPGLLTLTFVDNASNSATIQVPVKVQGTPPVIAFEPAYLASALEIGPVLRLTDGMSPGLTAGPGGVFCVLMPMRCADATTPASFAASVPEPQQATAIPEPVAPPTAAPKAAAA